jgi:hypothetical protein
VFADLIDGPLAHMPSGLFAANTAWATPAAITHNLLRAAGTLTDHTHAVARGATLRRHLVNVPARMPQAPGPRANEPCTYQFTGLEPGNGKPCGTTSSPITVDK